MDIIMEEFKLDETYFYECEVELHNMYIFGKPVRQIHTRSIYKIKPKIIEWLDENCNYDYCYEMNEPQYVLGRLSPINLGGYIKFIDESDAVAFKLKWS